MAQRRIVVGTTPVLLADYNKYRSFISIIMLPTNVEAGNTGNLFVGKGFTPVATVGSPSQGDILQQAGEIADSANYSGDTSVFKGQYWAVASNAGQVVFVDEAGEPERKTPVVTP